MNLTTPLPSHMSVKGSECTTNRRITVTLCASFNNVLTTEPCEIKSCTVSSYVPPPSSCKCRPGLTETLVVVGSQFYFMNSSRVNNTLQEVTRGLCFQSLDVYQQGVGFLTFLTTRVAMKMKSRWKSLCALTIYQKKKSRRRWWVWWLVDALDEERCQTEDEYVDDRSTDEPLLFAIPPNEALDRCVNQCRCILFWGNWHLKRQK